MTTRIGFGISDLLQDKRDAVLEIAAKHGAYNVRIFGSVARGEATLESDIDLLVDYDLDRISPWFPASLMLELEDLLHRKVDIVPSDSVHYFVKDRVFQEAVPL
ncbi:nucleotidyltransferase family protein [Vacuolonema iberomarrocanum]|uniref:nucleotidyltransferase family protein n=1 Tax=Vacuolonema iberomarrocanum TaxID=3454632 RepID=UPI0019FC864D|nr:nucleotidyltransferase domain-containing protein [filamentous cyanobacterium LEGE 07170]